MDSSLPNRPGSLRTCSRLGRTHLSAQVGDDDELLEHVLGQDVGEARLLDVVGRHVDVVRTQVQVGGGDGSHAPLRLGRKRLRLVVAGGRHDDLVAVDVGGARRGGRQLRLLFRLLLDLGDLLALLRRRGDLHTQDDVAYLGLRQRRYVHATDGRRDGRTRGQLTRGMGLSRNPTPIAHITRSCYTRMTSL